MERDIADFRDLVGKLSGMAHAWGSARGICDEEDAAEVRGLEAQVIAAYEQAQARAARAERAFALSPCGFDAECTEATKDESPVQRCIRCVLWHKDKALAEEVR